MHDSHKMEFLDCENCLWLDEWYAEIKKQPMTNADRIRSMTDEELAEFLSDITYFCRGRQDNYRCNECSLQKCGACNEICIGDWLKQEVGCE